MKPIAIISMGCRFPGGVVDPESYWELLSNGTDAIVDVPPDRWDLKRFYDPNPDKPGKTYLRQGGFLNQRLDRFDAAFFGISPREAAFVDPQQRLMLEITWEALQSGGIAPVKLVNSRTGVFVGSFALDSLISQMNAYNRYEVNSNAATGSSLAILANRISYVFGFQGPSVALDTACSSSLVAVHLACQSIWSGECDLALAGGVNTMFRPEYAIIMSKARFLSPDGRCKAFDESANGYSRGEGAGVVVLKPLEQAIADGDSIRAVILSTATNQDGRTPGISVPNGAAQQALLGEVYAKAGIRPAQIGYVEAHGTGTAVGDPIEANALGSVLGHGRAKETPCWMGSVKTNIGHLEAAAGVAGLMKAVLCLERKQIPPHLHLKKPNPRIAFDELGLKMARQLEPWQTSGDAPRYAGVNSFGYGGTNAHVVLQEAPPPAPTKKRRKAQTAASTAPAGTFLLPLCAQSKEALQTLAAAYLELPALRDGAGPKGSGIEELRNLCYSASITDGRLDHRLVCVARNIEELRDGLRAAAMGEQSPLVVKGQARHEGVRPVFVYTGMGPQWWAMARELYRGESVFKSALDRVDAIFRILTDEWGLLDELMKDESDSRMANTVIAQTTNFAVQIGLTELLQSWGIQPAAMVGHSVGEVAAAHASGALSLEDATRVSFHRSRLQARAAGTGKMLATDLSLAEAEPYLRHQADRAVVAAVNSPSSLTLAGEAAPLAAIAQKLNAVGRFNRFLQVEVPYHSPKMDPLHDDLMLSLSGLSTNGEGTKVPLYSTVSGALSTKTPLDAAYWWKNIRQPVLFDAAVGKLLEDGYDCFLEVGPHPVLSTSITQTIRQRARNGNVIASLHRKKPDGPALGEMLARLYTLGLALDWSKLNPAGERLRLPSYPWQREVHWSESTISRGDRLGSDGEPLLGEKVSAPQTTYEVELHGPQFPYLQDHRIEGHVIFPGAGYLESALEIGELGIESEGKTTVLGLDEVEFHKPLLIEPTKPAPLLRISYERAHASFSIHSWDQDPSSTYTLHATGKFLPLPADPSRPILPMEEIHARCTEEVAAPDLYARLRERGLEYGPNFQTIRSLWRGEGECLARVELPPTLTSDADFARYRLHPSLLDGAFQTLAAILLGEDAGNEGLCLPVGLGKLRLLARPGGKVWVHGRVTGKSKSGGRTVSGDLVLCDEKWRVCAEIQGMRFQFVSDEGKQIERQSSWLYEFAWREAEKPPSESPRGKIAPLVFMDHHEIGASLLQSLVPGEAMSQPVAVFAGESRACLAPGKYQIRPSASEDMCWLLDSLKDSAVPGVSLEIIYLWGCDLPQPDGDVSTEEITTRAIDQGTSILALTQVLSQRKERSRLWLVTCGAQSGGFHEKPAVTEASLWGLGRVIAAEHPELSPRMIDLDPKAVLSSLAAMVDEVLSSDRETEIAWRAGKRLVRRMIRPPAGNIDEKMENRPGGLRADVPFQLEVGHRGSFDSLVFRETTKVAPGPGEVRMRVQAVGLNFKDVLKVMGILSERIVDGTMSGSTLGLECSGIIEEVGPGVEDVKPGDEVVSCAPGCFRSHLVCKASMVFPKMRALSFEQEAALPVVFLTAYYSLHEIARLQKGERVLIHAATGGVGLAALQVARWLGAEIFATAGNPQKREHLRSLGITHIMDSRSLKFADEIMEMTGGKGVDVVLNSLSGEALMKSFSVLAPYGRFLEIGKRDIDENSPLGMRPFNRNLSFSSIDIDRLIAERPDYALRLVREVRTHFANESFAPLPVQTYPASQVEEAFRFLAQAKQIGKVVLSLRPANIPANVDGQLEEKGIPIAPPTPKPLRFKSDATYLVTGGLGGVGLKMAPWLVKLGARHLVLVGRSGAASEEAKQAIAALERQGVEVRVAAADISRREMVESLFADITRTMPPLRGVFHAAMVLDDGIILQLNRERYAKVMAPKMAGALHLHELTRYLPLDHFMLFSSVVAEIGNPGQASYAAANSFLDGLAQYRRSQGLPGLSVNWGALAGTGVVERNERIAQHLARQGWQGIPVRFALDILGRLLSENRASQVAVANVDWATWERAFPSIGQFPRLSELCAESGGQSGGRAEASWREALRAEAPENRAVRAEKLVQEAVARVLGFEAEKLDVNRRLDQLGVDSLMAVELQHVLQAHSGAEFSAMDLMRGPTVSSLAQLLLQRVSVL